jgi:hypothetical protein
MLGVFDGGAARDDAIVGALEWLAGVRTYHTKVGEL